MATIRKRGKTWQAIVRRQGVQQTATFDRRQDAEKWATAAEAAILRGSSGPDARKAQGLTVAGLLQRFADEVSPTRRGGRWERVRIATLVGEDEATGRPRFPGLHTPVSAFTARQAAEWRDARLRQVSALTVNRELNLISGVFQRAIKEWRVTETNPIRAITRPENPRPRSRRVADDERLVIAKALGWDGTSTPATSRQWAAWAFWLACATAMRQGEIASIRRQDLHLDRLYVHLPKTKNGDERDVPLSPEAIRLLRLAPTGRPDDRLVPTSASVIATLFGKARDAAGLKGLRFHDSRREGYTTLAGKLSLIDLMMAAGHRDPRQLRVYYRPDVTEMAKKLD